MDNQYLIQTKNIMKFYKEQIDFYKNNKGDVTEFNIKINDRLIKNIEGRYEELRKIYLKNK